MKHLLSLLSIVALAAVCQADNGFFDEIVRPSKDVQAPPPPPPPSEKTTIVVQKVVEPTPPPVAIPVVVPAAVPVESASPTVVTETVVVDDAELYAPPAQDATDPKRLVHYFCQMWKDEDYTRMYYAMEPAFRRKTSRIVFQKRFEDDKEFNGGLEDETIATDIKTKRGKTTLTVTLSYQGDMAKPKKVIAIVKSTPDGYRLMDSTILPLDMDDL